MAKLTPTEIGYTEMINQSDDRLLTDKVKQELHRIFNTDEAYDDMSRNGGSFAMMHALTKDGFFSQMDQDDRMRLALRVAGMLVKHRVRTEV